MCFSTLSHVLHFNKKLGFYKPNIFLPSNTTLVSKKILVSANQIFYQGQNRIFRGKKEMWGLEEKSSNFNSVKNI
jgi:hypothetical protein